MTKKELTRIKVITKLLEYIITNLNESFDIKIEDIKDINLNNGNIYLDLYTGERHVINLS